MWATGRFAVHFSNPMTIFLQYKSCRISIRCAVALALALVVSSAQAESEIGVPLAEVNGQAVTAEDLDHALGVKLTELQEQLYALKRAELDTQIAQRLLAQEGAKQGVSVAALLDAEVTAKVGLVTETEIESVYQANKSNLQGSETELREKIRASLQQRKLAAQRAQFVQVLRAQGTVVDRLQPPPVVRVQVSTDGGADSWDSGCSSDARGVFGLPLSVLQAGATDADPGA